MMLTRIVSLPIAMVLLLTLAACAGGAVEVNTVPTATTTAGVNPTNRPVAIPTNRPVVLPTIRPVVIPTNRPIIMPTEPSFNSTRPGVVGQMDPCNCHGYAGFGGPCYDGFGGPAYAGFGGPCYSGFGGTGKDCPSICKRKK
jgi:hypothetical protein